MTAAQSALASLVGNATKARVNIAGYHDTNTTQAAGHMSSSIKIEVTEIW